MTRTELFDKILEHLYNDPNHYHNLIPTCRESFGIKDGRMIESIGEELIERGWATFKNRDKHSLNIHYNGQQVYEKYGSYSLFLRSEKVAKKKAQRSKMTPEFIKIGITIIFGLSTAILGWLNYTDNKKLDNQEKELIKLNKTIDSLQTELKKQHTTKN